MTPRRACGIVGAPPQPLHEPPLITDRAERLLPPILRTVEGVTKAEQAAFAEYASAMTRQLAVVASAIMLAATLLWWPLDVVVFDDPDVVAGFAGLRWRAAAIEVLALLYFAARPPAASTRGVAVLAYAALLGSMGYSLGTIGPSALPWLADAFIGLVPVALIPMRLRHRLAATALVAVALATAFFAPFPDNLAAAGAASQISFLSFATLFSVAVGEVMTRVTRRAWFEGRALDRANRELAALTDSLSERVADRTARLHALTQHMDELREAERRRIAHDLHDDLGQQLTGVRYTAARIEQRLAGSSDELDDLFGDLSAALDGTATSMRAVLARLRPRILDDLGLVPALEWLCEDVEARSGVRCSFARTDDPSAEALRMAPTDELLLFRTVQEATTNALKHAAPSTIRVTLTVDDTHVRVAIEDDGRGFDAGAPSTGFGLFGLQERLRSAGGELHVDATPGAGARVAASLPIEPATAAEG